MPSYYVEGYITDQAGALLKGVTVQLVVNATGEKLLTPFVTTTGSYSAWTDKNPYEISVLFSKQGYTALKKQISSLTDNPDVTLIKANVSTASFPIVLVAAAAALVMTQNKKRKIGAIEAKYIVWILGGVVAFSVVKKLLEVLGIWDSADTKALENASTNPNSWWNPSYWLNKPSGAGYTNPITESTARSYAATIYNSFGAFNDNEEQAISVFKSLPSRAAGSFVADMFTKVYGQDLLTFLRGGIWPQDRLSDADVNEINQYVNRLPAY